ncbi:DUF2127 domain-containing protein [Noviherbaspirillum denitrificans]
MATGYASMHFCEEKGLWRQRRWSEWLAVSIGGIRVPFELYILFSAPS